MTLERWLLLLICLAARATMVSFEHRAAVLAELPGDHELRFERVEVAIGATD